MMRETEKFKKIDLDYRKAFTYMSETLENTNTMSKKAIELIDFEKGTFFTYLPVNVLPEEIYKFKIAKIAVNVRNFVRPVILNLLKENKDLICLFDDFNSEYISNYNEPFYLKHGKHIQKEIYYVLFSENATIDLVNLCCYCSEIIWHSLCILSKTQLSKHPNEELTIHEAEAICLNTQMLILTAYDGEGYIIWEKL